MIFCGTIESSIVGEPTPSSEMTVLLERWSGGDRSALEELVPIVHEELRKLASSYLERASEDTTVKATVLVHQVYLHLAGQHRVDARNRGRFFTAAAQVIRRILVDHARQARSLEYDGPAETGKLDEALEAALSQDVDFIALDAALTELEGFDPQKATVAGLHYFAGLSLLEIAGVLELAPAVIKRDWALARAWLWERTRGA
jgi:RNA polymerase sigma factor (TIGR02999 family)